VLSLADLKRNWLETGRGVLAGMPSTLEFHALRAALDRVEAETLAGVIRRHANAAAAARAGLRALGATLWIEDDRQASNLVTALLLPDGIDAGAACASATGAGAGLSPGVGAVADRIVRLTHTGASANRDAVLAGVRAIGALLAEAGVRVDPRAGEAAVAATYAGNRLSLPTA
jgi:aspartate aminotransferase-like enzyme